MSVIQQRLVSAGIALPKSLVPNGNYLPFVISGRYVFVSGQVSADHSGGIRGVVGRDLDLAAAVHAARLSGINVLAQMAMACNGELQRVRRVVKICGFVQAAETFTDIPAVIDGCSKLLIEILGNAGYHARSSVGVYRLPRNYAVEVDAVFEIGPRGLPKGSWSALLGG
jgi:enamine deaminase RidA (YjgF/YER057c/UK114 family)